MARTASHAALAKIEEVGWAKDWELYLNVTAFGVSCGQTSARNRARDSQERKPSATGASPTSHWAIEERALWRVSMASAGLSSALRDGEYFLQASSNSRACCGAFIERQRSAISAASACMSLTNTPHLSALIAGIAAATELISSSRRFPRRAELAELNVGLVAFGFGDGVVDGRFEADADLEIAADRELGQHLVELRPLLARDLP